MWVWILGGLALGVLVVFAGGVRHLRRSQKVAYERIRKVRLEDLAHLRDECERTFRDKFSEALDLRDYEKSARLLSERLDNYESLKRAFAKDDFYWYFVLPVGAYIGELLRVHARGEWKPMEEGGLKMELPVRGERATTFPFDKVMKQVTAGDKGGLYAYFRSALTLEALTAELEAREA